MESPAQPDSAETGLVDDADRVAGGSKSPGLVPIRDIGSAFAPQITLHLLELDERDRYLRFGYEASDREIRKYVDRIDFTRDQVYGIFNRRLQLIATAHLAYLEASRTRKTAEFGVSVAASARGRGYGSRLFERAAIHAVNTGIDTLYIYALSENTAMLRIAAAAGAVIERMGSESEAQLHLPAATFRSRLQELLANHVGQIDYWLKAEAALANQPATGLPGYGSSTPRDDPD